MTTEELTSAEQLQAIEPAWSDLWLRDRTSTPFQSPHWILPWWNHFGSGELHVLVQRDGGTIEALAPFFVLRDDDSGESLGLLIGTGITDYLDLLASPAAPIEALMDRLLTIDCALWDLQQLRPDSRLLSMRTEPWSDQIEDQDACPVLPLDGAGSDLEGLISSHFRKKLRYFRRSLERLGNVRIEHASEANLDELMTALFDLHAARWQLRALPGVLADETTQSFHRDVARRMLGAGALRMQAVRLDDRIVAVFYGLAHHATVYYYLSGYDPELEKLSVGTVIVANAIQQAVDEQAGTFDFLRGAEQYKYAWGAKDRMNRRRILTRPM